MDRIKTYTRIIIETGLIERLAFDSNHFKEAGIPSTPIYGMPKSEALQLVNKWNERSAVCKYFVKA